MNNYKVIIVGGGASGLFCAIELLSNGRFRGEEILILERNGRVGKKLVATGNGQGNLTNTTISEENYHGNPSFIREALAVQKEIDLFEYLSQLGIALTSDETGRCYPLSRQASAVLDIVRAKLSSKGCQIITGAYVQDVKNQADKYIVYVNEQKFTCDNVVLAFGGSAGSQFGTDGSSYRLAENFGHKKTPLYPSLVQLKTELNNIRGLKGLKERVKIYAYDGEKPLKTESGDLLFTEYGISGDSVFRLSSVLVGVKNPRVKIEFLPDYTEKQVVSLIENLKKSSELYNENPLVGLLNKRIGLAIYKKAGNNKPEQLAKTLKNFYLNVTGTLGFNNAQVTKGGISTDKINPRNFESKLSSGLYILGEAIDVDGDCGGYNLTFAFKSAIICAKDIKSKAQNNHK